MNWQRMTSYSVALLLTMFAVVMPTARGDAQEIVALADKGPRFLYSSLPKSAPLALDVRTTPVLRQQVSLEIDDGTLANALEAITRQTGIAFVYSADVIRPDARVSLRAAQITVAAALTEILLDSGVDVLLTSPRQAALVKRPPRMLGTITGRVTDAVTGQPVAGAEIRVVGTRLAATANESGEYIIRNAPAGEQRLTARRIGYQADTRPVTVPDGGTVTLDFTLEAVPTRLAEVVSTVTGAQRRMEVGNTIVSLNADSLVTTAPVRNLGDLLLARAPGVLSLQEAGAVGSAGRIRIRGLNSALVSNDPIVIIDGARVEASAAADARESESWLATGGRTTGRLADIDPEEIASIEIVKGPSASTLYGTDAANGVIVITTKRGQAGARPRWTGFMDQGLLQQRVDFDDVFPTTYYSFGRSTATDEPLRCTLLMQAAAECVVDSLVSFNPFKISDLTPFDNGYRSQYGVQVSGGVAGGSTYFMSLGTEEEIGPTHMPAADQALVMAERGVSSLPDWQLRPNAYRRLNLRGNFMTPIGPRATATFSTGFVANKARRNESYAYWNVGYRDDNDGWVRYGPDANFRPGYRFAQRENDDVRRFTSSLSTTYNALDWLVLRATAGADLSSNTGGYLLRTGEYSPGNTASQRTAEDYQHTLYTLDLGATATRQLSPAFSSRTSVGMQYNRRSSRSTYIMGVDLPLGGETVEGAAFFYANMERTNNTAVAGGYIEEQLGLRDRLFLTGSLRFDGASTFGQDFATATYPKVGVSWVVSDGNVGPRFVGVNALRLRTSYGTSGVQPGPADALSLVQPGVGVNVDRPGVTPGGTITAGNPALRPERTSEFEGGFDAELAASRVRIEFTGYRRTSTDALVRRPNGPDVGGTQVENLGSVRNEGLELLLSADVLRGGALGAGFTVTGSVNRNRLLKLGEGVTVRNPLSEWDQHELGYPLYGLWGFVFESVADANGNGIIEPDEFQLSAETRFLGSSFPMREATASPYVALFRGRLHLSGLFQYRGGFYRKNFGKASCFAPGDSCQAANDPSTPLAEQARMVAYTTQFRNGVLADDGSYAMLRELSARFTLSPSLARYARAGGGSVALSARNVGVLWKASDVPIENAGISSDLSGYSSAGLAGPLTTWLLRVHLNY